MADHCPLCRRPKKPPSEFCAFHYTAQTNLEAAYAVWCKSIGLNLTKEEYYARLEKRDETGAAVKALIQYLRKNGGVA
ncbi:MAG: hypothetical protein ABSA50_07610 [Candidatus Bathyarchaeia archaeon]|jgi:hypothetical protein